MVENNLTEEQISLSEIREKIVKEADLEMVFFLDSMKEAGAGDELIKKTEKIHRDKAIIKAEREGIFTKLTEEVAKDNLELFTDRFWITAMDPKHPWWR